MMFLDLSMTVLTVIQAVDRDSNLLIVTSPEKISREKFKHSLGLLITVIATEILNFFMYFFAAWLIYYEYVRNL